MRTERNRVFSAPVLGVGVGKGPFSCFINLGEMGFVPSYIFVLLLPSSGQGAAGESGSCCSAQSRQHSPVRARSWMAQPSIFISSHHLQHGRSSLGELEQASPLHTFKPGPHYPVHFATRIWQQTDIKSPPGGLR